MKTFYPLFANSGLLGGGPELGGTEVIILPFFLGWWAFWLWMLIDCIRFEKAILWKVVWSLIIIFTTCIGAPLYYFIRKRPRGQEIE